jgi:hypothetical protein
MAEGMSTGPVDVNRQTGDQGAGLRREVNRGGKKEKRGSGERERERKRA